VVVFDCVWGGEHTAAMHRMRVFDSLTEQKNTFLWHCVVSPVCAYFNLEKNLSTIFKLRCCHDSMSNICESRLCPADFVFVDVL